MKFGYTIIYVSNVQQTMNFYTKAFGFHTKFLHESAMYGEMETGETTLAFAANILSEQNGLNIAHNNLQNPPAGIEIAFVTDNINDAYQKAVDAGAQALKEPTQKPWGQIVAYVRDINGVLIELCTPIQ
jgi:predicted enzyme related to lactoylglutathione lyase